MQPFFYRLVIVMEYLLSGRDVDVRCPVGFRLLFVGNVALANPDGWIKKILSACSSSRFSASGC